MQSILGFVGMTHLGLVTGVSAAEKGFRVVCFDPDPARISPLLQGILPVSEPLLRELVEKNKASIEFTPDAVSLQACDVVFVAPDVQTDDLGGSDLGPINALLDQVFEASRKDTTIVVLSQVPPGYTRNNSGTVASCYYQVEP